MKAQLNKNSKNSSKPGRT
ncbi:hypothetical protein MYD04_13215 [Mediterraneibacter gnavus]